MGAESLSSACLGLASALIFLILWNRLVEKYDWWGRERR